MSPTSHSERPRLRDAVSGIVGKRFGPEFVAAVSWPMALNQLAIEMFAHPEKFTEDEMTTVRRTFLVYEEKGYVDTTDV